MDQKVDGDINLKVSEHRIGLVTPNPSVTRGEQ
jgi:hypothetical protein